MSTEFYSGTISPNHSFIPVQELYNMNELKCNLQQGYYPIQIQDDTMKKGNVIIIIVMYGIACNCRLICDLHYLEYDGNCVIYLLMCQWVSRLCLAISRS